MAQMKGLEANLKRLARVPQVAKTAVGSQLAKEVEDLVEAQKRAAPVDEASDNPGRLRESIHFYPNPDRPLSYRVIADARDPETGDFIGPHVEFGHMAADGTHVAAVPSFFPTYRARKKSMKRRISAAGRKALREAFPKPVTVT